jgi:hypothetical protein
MKTNLGVTITVKIDLAPCLLAVAAILKILM